MLRPSEESDHAVVEPASLASDDATTTSFPHAGWPGPGRGDSAAPALADDESKRSTTRAPAREAGDTARAPGVGDELDATAFPHAAFVPVTDGPSTCEASAHDADDAATTGDELDTTSFPHAANTAMTDLSAVLFGADAGMRYATLCEGRCVPLGIRLRVALDVLADLSRRGALAIATDEVEQALSIGDVHLGMDGVASVRGRDGVHGGAELLWEVLAGQVLRGAPPPLSSVADDVPRSIVEVVERALAGEMLFSADVLEPFAHAAAALAAEREDVRRVVAVPAALPSQRPPPVPDAETAIDVQRALVMPALAQFTRSQLRTRPALELGAALESARVFRVPEVVGSEPSEPASPPEAVASPSEEVASPPEAVASPSEEVASPSEVVASPSEEVALPPMAEGQGSAVISPAERADAPPALPEASAAADSDGDVAVSGTRARPGAWPERVVGTAPRGAPPPGALLATRRHVDVAVLAMTPVADDRAGGVRSLAPIHRSVHAPSPQRMRTRALLPAIAAAALLVAAVAWVPRGPRPDRGHARAGLELVASPVRLAALTSASDRPPGDIEATARPAVVDADQAAQAPPSAGSAEAPVTRLAPGAEGPAPRRAAVAPRPGGTQAAVIEAALATRGTVPSAARGKPARTPRAERPVHEGVVDPGY